MVDDLPSLPELHVDHIGALAAMTLCRGDDPRPQFHIPTLTRLVSQCTDARADHSRTAAFRLTLARHPPTQLLHRHPR